MKLCFYLLCKYRCDRHVSALNSSSVELEPATAGGEEMSLRGYSAAGVSFQLKLMSMVVDATGHFLSAPLNLELQWISQW